VPDWITFTLDGKRLYVANSGSNSVSVIDTGARKEIVQIPVGEVPNGTERQSHLSDALCRR